MESSLGSGWHLDPDAQISETPSSVNLLTTNGAGDERGSTTLPIGLNPNRDFLMVWFCEAVSDLGTYIGSVSISFAAVIALGATPLQMALLAMATNLPALLFSLFTGVWVDRLRRRPLMIACDLGRFVLLVTVPLAALAGILRMPHLYAVIFAASLLDLVFGVAYRAYLPSLVPTEHLLPANSRLTAT